MYNHHATSIPRENPEKVLKENFRGTLFWYSIAEVLYWKTYIPHLKLLPSKAHM
jgi:hypothetical protein